MAARPPAIASVFQQEGGSGGGKECEAFPPPFKDMFWKYYIKLCLCSTIPKLVTWPSLAAMESREWNLFFKDHIPLKTEGLRVWEKAGNRHWKTTIPTTLSIS